MNQPLASKPDITMVRGRLITTSLEVAERFGKNHRDVLRAVRNLECSESFRRRNFAPTFQEIPGPKNSMRQEPMFHITRDGFAFLAMGFTGKEAAQWKECFLETFNRMEQSLRATRTMRAIRMEETLFTDHPRWETIRDALEIGYPMETILRLTGYKSPSSIRRQARAMERYGLLERRKGWKERARWRVPRLDPT
ncbi:MAG: Rha family transcriptional regulator [Magnetococcales bacterium]|nr:Rha family transcriptional regulator [Magnetococcales bacterium]